ncbi:hypothetical protein F5B21DRAFT_496116 [Xylaria acuta]|nr:hypothetical protein F5B21DRAFT_496116 [Xylaria acuta]
MLRLESPWKSIPDLRTYFFYWIMQRLLVIPFGTVLCFVLIPTPKRLPFLSGVVLISSAFILAVVRLLIPWLIQTGPVQRRLSDMTTELKNGVHAADEL